VWVHEILELGLRQLRIQRALALYQAGAGSLGYAAEQAGIPKSDLICEARARGIVPLFDDQTVSEELGK
jgi:predicted HTH domain antitoxin